MSVLLHIEAHCHIVIVDIRVMKFPVDALSVICNSVSRFIREDNPTVELHELRFASVCKLQPVLKCCGCSTGQCKVGGILVLHLPSRPSMLAVVIFTVLKWSLSWSCLICRSSRVVVMKQCPGLGRAPTLIIKLCSFTRQIVVDWWTMNHLATSVCDVPVSLSNVQSCMACFWSGVTGSQPFAFYASESKHCMYICIFLKSNGCLLFGAWCILVFHDIKLGNKTGFILRNLHRDSHQSHIAHI